MADRAPPSIGEFAYLGAKDGNDANCLPVLEHRHGDHRANAADLNGINGFRVAGEIRSSFAQIGDLDWLAGRECLECLQFAVRLQQHSDPPLLVPGFRQ